MRWQVEDEMERFKDDLEQGNLLEINNYFDETDWEDDYSHNEIAMMQYEFSQEIKKYLDEIGNTNYVVADGVYCVHIVTKSYYEEKIKPFMRIRK